MRISDWSSDVCSSDLLHAGEAAQAAVAALEFLADQAVADTVEAGAAVFLRQGRAKHADAGDLGDQFGREASLVEAVADDRQHALVGEPGHGVLDSALLFAEQEADVVQVVGMQGPSGFFGSVKEAIIALLRAPCTTPATPGNQKSVMY